MFNFMWNGHEDKMKVICMEFLRNWALTVALSALAGGVVWLLAPKGSVQKAVRTVVAVFLLCAFLSPLFWRREVSPDWIWPEVEIDCSAMEEAVTRQLQAAVETELERRMQAVMDERKITGQIRLETDILSDGSIEIVTAEVIVPRGANTAGLAAALGAATELDVKIAQED
ncbi:MAG: hypothetical protein LBB50_05440 [Oscillospiraceae bacterium]|jgi:hypothetical protein|nr:hypothetical protein [Oscillospiraceae bacterium]